MKKLNENGKTLISTWLLISIIGDLFGIFGIATIVNVLYKKFAMNDLDMLGKDVGYLILFGIIAVIIIAELLKNIKLNNSRKVKNDKLDLENKDVTNIYEDLKYQISGELKKVQTKTNLVILAKRILSYAAVYGFGYLIVLFNQKEYFTNNAFLSMIIILLALVCLIFSLISLVDLKNRKLQVYTKKYREAVVLPTLKRIDNNLKFVFDIDELEGEISSKVVKQKFDESGIATEPYNKFFVDDVILNDTDNFKIYEIDVNKMRKVNGSPAYSSFFKGLFLELDSEKNVENKVKIGSAEIKNYSHDFTVNISNEEFNKNFYVMSENNDLAKEIVNDDMVQKLIKLYDKYDIPFELSFVGKKVYARLLTGEMFEPRLYGTTINKTSIANCYCALELVKELRELIK